MHTMRKLLLLSLLASLALASPPKLKARGLGDDDENWGGFEMDATVYVRTEGGVMSPHPSGFMPIPMRVTHTYLEQTIVHFRLPDMYDSWKRNVIEPWMYRYKKTDFTIPSPEFFGYTAGPMFKKPSETVTLLPFSGNVTVEKRQAIYSGQERVLCAWKDYVSDDKAKEYIHTNLTQDAHARHFLYAIQAAQRLLSPPNLLADIITLADEGKEKLGAFRTSELVKYNGEAVEVRVYMFNITNDTPKRYSEKNLPFGVVKNPMSRTGTVTEPPVVSVAGTTTPVGTVKLSVRDNPYRFTENGIIEEIAFYSGTPDAHGKFTYEQLLVSLQANAVGPIPSEMPPEGW
eukprot:GDKI01021484.1.p1 GENE.GDKI01021484.1~~GDKI01021484.1.p1  ORF type:complete len:345 (-),score=85.13 GDKI01021484.1:24-1058(-)